MDPPPGLDLALPPFSLLDAAGRARLLDSLDMGFHPAGEILMSAGQPSAHVYVLLKGQARAYDLDQDGREQPFADYGPGEVFGAWAAITGSASYHFRASTVCLSFLIPTPVFRSLVADQPAFAAYFSERLSVRGQLAEPSRPEQAELMLAQAGDAQLAPVERVPAGASIAQAAARLRERQVDCLLVDDPDHPHAPGADREGELLVVEAIGQHLDIDPLVVVVELLLDPGPRPLREAGGPFRQRGDRDVVAVVPEVVEGDLGAGEPVPVPGGRASEVLEPPPQHRRRHATDRVVLDPDRQPSAPIAVDVDLLRRGLGLERGHAGALERGPGVQAAPPQII